MADQNPEPNSDAGWFSDLPMNRAPRATCQNLDGRICFVTLANILNISLGGVGIETQDSLQVDHFYKIHIDGADLALESRAVWRRHAATRQDEAGEFVSIYRSGLQFDHPSVWNQRDSLQHFLEIHTDAPIGVERAVPRFSMRSDTPRILQTNFRLDVQILSATGMVARCDSLPEANTPLNIVLTLPGEEVRVRARMVDVLEEWDGDQLSRQVAFGFENTPEHSRNAIDQFVRQQTA
jgi:hypothetical protein